MDKKIGNNPIILILFGCLMGMLIGSGLMGLAVVHDQTSLCEDCSHCEADLYFCINRIELLAEYITLSKDAFNYTDEQLIEYFEVKYNISISLGE